MTEISFAGDFVSRLLGFDTEGNTSSGYKKISIDWEKRINGGDYHNKTYKELFLSRIEKGESCWRWTGTINNRGQGVIQLGGAVYLASRLMWYMSYGNLDVDLCVCHSCENRVCVNPEHLFLSEFPVRSKNYVDMTGQVWGRLTVLRRDGSDSKGEAMFLCRCTCGRQTRVKGKHLRSGNTKGCGACYNERRRARHEGEIHGSWRVERFVRRDKNGNPFYTVACIKCEKIKTTALNNLRRGEWDHSCDYKEKLIEKHSQEIRKLNYERVEILGCVGYKKSGRTVWEVQCRSCGRRFNREFSGLICSEPRCKCKNRTKQYVLDYQRKQQKIRHYADKNWTEEQDRLLRDMFKTCVVCGISEERSKSVFRQPLTIDHVVPVTKGGRKEPGNVTILCVGCNRRKWNKDLDELPSSFREPILETASLFKTAWDALTE